jgi:hypothetical protein
MPDFGARPPLLDAPARVAFIQRQQPLSTGSEAVASCPKPVK